MKIRTKILSGFMVMALVAVLLGVTGMVSTAKLNGISTELQKLQHENDSITKVLNSHYVWRQGLTEAVLTGNAFAGAIDPHSCALGQWYNSEEAKTMSDPELLNMLDHLAAPHAKMHNEAKTVSALIKSGDLIEARAYLEGVIFPETAKVISVLIDMQARYLDLVETKDAESVSIAGIIQIINVAFIAASVIICFYLAFYIAGYISKPLVPLAAFMHKAGSTGDITLLPEDIATIVKYVKVKDEIGQTINGAASFIKHITLISDELKSVASGDLSIDIKLLSEKDTIGKSVKQVVDNLNDMFGEISSSTSQVSSGASQIADGAQALAQGSTEQAAAIQQLSSSIAEIAKKTKANAATAEETSKLSVSIIQDAEKGNQKMDEMIESVCEINEASKNISKIIKTIDDIAFQTNILALNAAVEAARAGQHGKGFAVVAEEVRNLASKSAEAAKDTGNMIQNSMEKAEFGSRIAHETADSLKDIVTGISEASRLVTEIAKSSEEQSLGITQINVGIDQVAQVIQQNSATAQESAAASEEMNDLSHILGDMVMQFKLKDNNAVAYNLSAMHNNARKVLAMPGEGSYDLEPACSDYGKY